MRNYAVGLPWQIDYCLLAGPPSFASCERAHYNTVRDEKTCPDYYAYIDAAPGFLGGCEHVLRANTDELH